jgi:hypothetical protein
VIWKKQVTSPSVYMAGGRSAWRVLPGSVADRFPELIRVLEKKDGYM